MQFLRCSAPHLTFCSFMQTGTLIAWKTSFSFVDVKIDVVFRPCCPFIVNTKLHDDEWTLRTNKSQVLYLRPVANLHSSIRTIIGSAPSGRCHPVTSRVNSIYWSRPTTTFSICIPNPNRSGPLCPEPVRSAAPELATAYPLRDIAIYEQYVLQMTGSNFLPISKIKINFSF